MSATIEVPKGIDTLSADEQRLMEQMRDDGDDGADTVVAARRPEPAAPATAETAEEGADADGAQQPRTVPHQALHAERERRKGVEKELATLRERTAADNARLQERVDLLVKVAEGAAARPAAAAAEEPLPDVNADPVGHFRALADRQARELGDMKAIMSGFQQQQQQNARIAEMRNWGSAQEAAFEAREPSYRDAMRHLESGRIEELKAIGVLDPSEQRRIIGTDIHAIAVRAREEGADFAERLYALAQQRGFKKAAPAASAIPPIDQNTIAVPEGAQQRREAARDNAVTIGSLGAAPATRLSVDKIANMSEPQFAALLKRIDGDPVALRDLMGH